MYHNLILQTEHEAFQIISQDSTEMQSHCIERRIAKLPTYLVQEPHEVLLDETIAH